MFKKSKPEIELMYRGKKSLVDILHKTESAELKLVKIFYDNQLFINEFANKKMWINMLIYGENLKVLKTLFTHNDIKGKIRLVYIDPPFGTGQKWRSGRATISSSNKDQLAYEDFSFSPQYLEFLRERLVLLRELLSDDGSIYVHIDCKVGHYVKILMDEIFGPNNFRNDITRIKCNPKNFARKGYGNFKDMILFYSKTSKFVWNDSREPFTEDEIEKLFPKVDEKGRRYTTTPLHAPGETENGATGQQWRGLYPPKGRHWRYPPEILEQLDKQGLIEWSSSGVPRKKIYADEYIKRGKKRQDVWEFKDPPYPSYPTEKNLEMLKVIIQASSHPGDIVLDAFSGSGTTLVAAELLGRRWIGIDNSVVAINIAIRRLLKIKNHAPFGLFNATHETMNILL